MIKDRAQLAAYIALAYILVMLGGIFLHYAQTGDAYTLKFSLMLPSTWVVTIAGGVIALGLWLRKAWAWWLGLGAVLIQLTRISSWLAQHYSFTKPPAFSVLFVLAILVIFLAVLSLPKTRAACSR